MSINRKILPKENVSIPQIFKKRPYEDQINFDKLRLYRLNRVKKELEKNDIGACLLFDPVNVRYATDSRNMSIFCMHNLHRYCFVPVNGPVILYEFFKCNHINNHLKLIDEIRPSIIWDYFGSGNQADQQVVRWGNEINDLVAKYCGKEKKLAIDVCNSEGIFTLNNLGINIIEGKKILEQARKIKSKQELLCMKAALEVADKGIQLMRKKLKSGMSEEELWAILHKTNIENGGEWIETRLLSSGPRTNPWMNECSSRVIQKKDIVSFDTDMVGPYGYCADISRTFVEGNVFSKKQRELYSIALEQINYNKEIIKLNMTFEEFIDKAWVLPEPYYNNRYSCISHGIGMCDEWPFILYPEDNKKNGGIDGMFEENMTITLESYIGASGDNEGVKLEQQYLVKQNGLELLSFNPLEVFS